MFRFRMVVAGEVEMDRGLARFTDGIADWRPIWPVFGDNFYAHLRQTFATEGDAGPGRWAPLSEKYAEWKARRFPGRPILERTGRLVASLTGPKAPGSIFKATPQSLTVGSEIPYGIYHQTGTDRMPQRKEIALPEAAKREMMRIAQMYLIQIASSAGFRRGLTPTEVGQLHAAKAKYPHWPLPWEKN